MISITYIDLVPLVPLLEILPQDWLAEFRQSRQIVRCRRIRQVQLDVGTLPLLLDGLAQPLDGRFLCGFVRADIK